MNASTNGYVLDNRHAAAEAHHRALAELLDPFTTARIRALDDWSAARCLEVGAGHGSIARWLAGEVDDTARCGDAAGDAAGGEVVAADLEPGGIPGHRRLRAVRVDLGGDHWPDALRGPFDLIHARLTLGHIPGRRQVLARLGSRLGQGGVLLVEDWAPMREPMVVVAPTAEAAELYATYQHTAARVFDTAGNDPTWARHVHAAMREDGLVDVETVIHGRYWTGGDPGCRLVAAAVCQLRPRLREAGMTEHQLDQLNELLADPGLVVHGHPLYSTSGRRVPGHFGR